MGAAPRGATGARGGGDRSARSEAGPAAARAAPPRRPSPSAGPSQTKCRDDFWRSEGVVVVASAADVVVVVVQPILRRRPVDAGAEPPPLDGPTGPDPSPRGSGVVPPLNPLGRRAGGGRP